MSALSVRLEITVPWLAWAGSGPASKTRAESTAPWHRGPDKRFARGHLHRLKAGRIPRDSKGKTQPPPLPARPARQLQPAKDEYIGHRPK
ncbi:hypothetical protein GCM10028789_11580 [Sinomonas halotolerans]